MEQRADDQGTRIARIEAALKAIQLELDDTEKLFTQRLLEAGHTRTEVQHTSRDTQRLIMNLQRR